VLHLVAFRQFGGVGPWNPQRREQIGRFWPDQAYKDILVSSFVVVVLVGLCAFERAPITGVADPLGRAITPKPVWNFLFLYQALKVFKGPWETAGTVGLPAILILILLLLPLYDRNPQASPSRRPIAMIGGLVLVLGVITLTTLGYFANPSAYGAKSNADPDAGDAAPAQNDPPAPDAAAKGRALFQSQHCDACHRIDGKGGTVGPDLSNEANAGRSADWLAAQIRDAKVHDPQSIMPAYTSLSQGQVKDLVDYVSSLRSGAGKSATQEHGTVAEKATRPSGKREPAREAARLIGNWREGKTLFAAYCSSCHGPEGTDKVANPGSDKGTVPALNPIARNLWDKDPSVFTARIDRFIQEGSTPSGPHPALHMPAYGNKKGLTQPQIAAVEAYILRLNGADRAQILRPGMAPRQFFLLTAIVFGAVWAIITILGEVSKRKRKSAQSQSGGGG
jgi:menaquinol-cytochrome c reductase cytochrome b/c subunit